MKKTLALLICCSLWVTGCKGNKDDDSKKKEAISVQVFKVAGGSIARKLSYDADVKGELEVRVFSQVPERILSLKADEGDQVKKGQILAVLRSDSLSGGVRSALAAVDAARADRDNIKNEVRRAEQLLAKRVVSQAQVDQLQSRYLSAEAQVRRLEALSGQASTARGKAFVRAPISGVIGRRFLNQGDMAPPSLPIFNVVLMDRVELILEVPEQNLPFVRQGMTALVRVARHGDRAFSGKVELIAPTIDRQTRTARIKVLLDNPEHSLMPGMLARVDLVVESRDNVPVVPYSALVIESGAEGAVAYKAYVVQGGVARERLLTLGLIDDSVVEVIGGLKFGDRMVSRGQHLLEEGRAVEVTERVTLEGRKIPLEGSPPAGRPAAAAEKTKGQAAKEQSL